MKNNNYSYFQSYIFRVPSLPVNNEVPKSISRDDCTKYFMDSAFIQKAIFIASEALFKEITTSISTNMGAKLQEALLKYILRMHTRCTPYGLFSGCSRLGSIHRGESQIIIENPQLGNQHLRWDMSIVYMISKQLIKQRNVRENIKWFPNNTLYEAGGDLRYIEALFIDWHIKYNGTRIKKNEYLLRILENSKKGVFMSEIVLLLKKEGFEEDEIFQYVNCLIDNQVLMPEIELSTIEVKPIERMINVLKKRLSCIDENLTFINSLVEMLNMSTANNDNSFFENTYAIVDNNYFLKDTFSNNYFQLDLEIKTIHNALSESVVDALKEGFEVLNKLTPYYEDEDMNEFKNAFLEKYESDEIPILKLMDAEIGIGYPLSRTKLKAPLIDDITFVYPKKEYEKVRWSKQTSFMANKLGISLQKNQCVIEIKEQELEQFDKSIYNTAPTYSALAELYKINNGEEIYISGFSSPAANYYGRFAHLDIENNFCFIKKLYDKEREFVDENTIFAEISHFPDARVGNILLRPSFTEYEIPISAVSLLPVDRQIPLSDLLVSVRDNTVTLRSKRLNKIVIPRMSTAHNYMRYDNIPIYKFLCNIYNQKTKKSVAFDWGILKTFPYLPRVIYKNLILSKAQWTIKSESIQSFDALSDTDLLHNVEEWKDENKLPSIVTLKDNDNKLCICLENIDQIKLLISCVKKRVFFVLEEFLFSLDNGFIYSEEDDIFTNEFVFSCYKNVSNART